MKQWDFRTRLRKGRLTRRAEEASLQLEMVEGQMVRKSIRLEGGRSKTAAECFCAGDHSDTGEADFSL